MDDNGWLCAMEHRLRLKRFPSLSGLDPRPLDQRASALPTELPGAGCSKLTTSLVDVILKF